MKTNNKIIVKKIEFVKKLFLLIIILLALSSTASFSDPYLIVFFILLLFAFFNLKINKNNFFKEFLLWELFLVYTIISSVIGLLFFAEIYFDYKALVFNFFGLFIPVLMGIILRKPLYLILFYQTWLKWGVVIAGLSILFIPGYQVGKVFSAIIFIAIFFKEIPIKYKLISILIILIGLVLNSGSRSVLVRSMFFLAIALSTYFPLIIKKIKPIILIVFLIPILLFFSAAYYNFNIFSFSDKDSSGITIKDSGESGAGSDGQRSLSTDTRSFLYLESFRAAIKYDYIFFGRTPARGHETFAFFGDGKDGTRRGERNGDEVGILNIFNWLGIFGIIILSSCFFYSIWLGLYRTNNLYTIYGALMLQFFWIYTWLEEIQGIRWDYIIIFLIVPFVTSKSFRQMNDIEMKKFIKIITKG